MSAKSIASCRVIRDIRKNKYLYLLLLPAVTYTFLFGYMTLPYLLIAFQRFTIGGGLLDAEWIGLENFRFFFLSPHGLRVTFNTFFLNALFLGLGTLFSVTMAILLNEFRGKFLKRVAQSVMIMPFFISWVIASYIIFSLFSFNLGIMNSMLTSLGFSPINWYTNPQYWRIILVCLNIWRFGGINTIIYLAAITGIDSEIYEAGRIDGASRWQQIRFLTLPILLPTISILVLLGVGRVFFGDFAMIYSIIRDNGILFPTVDVIDTFVFRTLRQTGNFSWSAAIGLYQSTLGLILIFITNKLVKKFFPEGALF